MTLQNYTKWVRLYAKQHLRGTNYQKFLAWVAKLRVVIGG